jgi:hypothetical protein
MKKNRHSKILWHTIMKITCMQVFMILLLTTMAWANSSGQEILDRKITLSIAILR